MSSSESEEGPLCEWCDDDVTRGTTKAWVECGGFWLCDDCYDEWDKPAPPPNEGKIGLTPQQYGLTSGADRGLYSDLLGPGPTKTPADDEPKKTWIIPEDYRSKEDTFLRDMLQSVNYGVEKRTVDFDEISVFEGPLMSPTTLHVKFPPKSPESQDAIPGTECRWCRDSDPENPTYPWCAPGRAASKHCITGGGDFWLCTECHDVWF